MCVCAGIVNFLRLRTRICFSERREITFERRKYEALTINKARQSDDKSVYTIEPTTFSAYILWLVCISVYICWPQPPWTSQLNKVCKFVNAHYRLRVCVWVHQRFRSEQLKPKGTKQANRSYCTPLSYELSEPNSNYVILGWLGLRQSHCKNKSDNVKATQKLYTHTNTNTKCWSLANVWM